MGIRESIMKTRSLVTELSMVGSEFTALKPVPSKHLSRLRATGTSHIYADTADVHELTGVASPQAGEIFQEVNGNTVNQPLALKVADAYLKEGKGRDWAAALRETAGDLPPDTLDVLLYTIFSGRIGRDFRALAGDARPWETSLQLHMGLTGDAEGAAEVARLLREMVPTAIIKVPFTPHAPECFLLARDLERAGIPVNFTSTFSARQALAAALLGDVARTNVFMGRLNDGLDATLLGEQAVLDAQRAICGARREDGVKTRLIVASIREWKTFPRCAGCDVFTAPCEAIGDFLGQEEGILGGIENRLETSYEQELRIGEHAERRLGRPSVTRLFRIEPEFTEFLRALRRSGEYRDMRHGDQLALRFEEAGFGDFFHLPSNEEWSKLREKKLPDLDAPLATKLALDTHFSLLADADFEKSQAEISAKLAG